MMKLLLQMVRVSHESCLSTRSIWRETKKGNCLHRHLFPSAPTRQTTTFLDIKVQSWTWQPATSLSQSYWRASFAILWILQKWKRRRNQKPANLMDLFSSWTQTLIVTRWTWGTNHMNKDNLKSMFTRLLSTLLMGQEPMPWVASKGWQGLKASRNFLTTKKDVVFTAETIVRQRTSLIKFGTSVSVFHGLWWMALVYQRLGTHHHSSNRSPMSNVVQRVKAV